MVCRIGMVTRSQADGPRTNAETSTLSADEVFDLLGHRHRRVLLACLTRSEQPLHQRTIAIEIACRDDDRSREDVSEIEIDRVQTALHHSHVPKLRDHGIVSTTGEGLLVLEDGFDHLEPHLDLVGELVGYQ